MFTHLPQWNHDITSLFQEVLSNFVGQRLMWLYHKMMIWLRVSLIKQQPHGNYHQLCFRVIIHDLQLNYWCCHLVMEAEIYMISYEGGNRKENLCNHPDAIFLFENVFKNYRVGSVLLDNSDASRGLNNHHFVLVVTLPFSSVWSSGSAAVATSTKL